MKKDKLITIRVTEETRDQFNDWCKANKLKGSIFLYEIISGCINGQITPSLTSQKIDNSIDSKASQKIVELENQVNNLSSQLAHLEQDLGAKLYNKLYNSISNKLINKSIDKDIDESLDLDTSIDKSIDSDLVENPTRVETEMTELEEGISQGTITAEESYLPLTDDSRGEKSQEKADTVDSIDKPTHEGSIDINPELILSQRQLATRLGYKSHKSLSAKFKSLSKEDFIEWTKSKDPDRLGWYKQGKTFEIVE